MNIFLYSDPHFSHAGVCKFMNDDGTKLRPWDNPEEMDEALVELYNETVSPKDKVYFLGDVAINRRGLKVLARLNGEKVLIKGNHDIFRIGEYIEYFKDVRACHVLSGMIFTHIPVHPNQLYRFGTNIHGHLHGNRVLLPNGEIDPQYYSVCVEQINFNPISLEEVKVNIVKQGGVANFKF